MPQGQRKLPELQEFSLLGAHAAKCMPQMSCKADAPVQHEKMEQPRAMSSHGTMSPELTHSKAVNLYANKSMLSTCMVPRLSMGMV